MRRKSTIKALSSTLFLMLLLEEQSVAFRAKLKQSTAFTLVSSVASDVPQIEKRKPGRFIRT